MGKSEISEEIKMMVATGNLCYYCGLQYTLSLRTANRIPRIKMYNSVLKSVVKHGPPLIKMKVC
jgi:hypothetical protein